MAGTLVCREVSQDIGVGSLSRHLWEPGQFTFTLKETHFHLPGCTCCLWEGSLREPFSCLQGEGHLIGWPVGLIDRKERLGCSQGLEAFSKHLLCAQEGVGRSSQALGAWQMMQMKRVEPHCVQPAARGFATALG